MFFSFLLNLLKSFKQGNDKIRYGLSQFTSSALAVWCSDRLTVQILVLSFKSFVTL